MPVKPVEVYPYTHQRLMRVLTRKARTSAQTMAVRIHGIYFRDYFSALQAKTMVVENHYVDQHYLDDFAGYYVGCFNEYGRTCARIHFFSLGFAATEFEALLRGKSRKLTQDSVKNAYIGFVVVKPLPTTIIGRTCLRTYEGKGREFPITRDYRASLFGISLKVKSIAFQEQDTVAAACATSALWSAFHCTGEVFHHYIPSPVEITTAAKVGSIELTKALPSKGLTYPELAQGVRSVGLEPLIVGGGSNRHVLSSTVYAYLKGKVPVVLGINLVTKTGHLVGKHAITITGFRLSPGPKRSGTGGGISLRADRMTRIYAHDDQVGPFARMLFKTEKSKGKTIFYLTTSFGGVGTHVAIAENMVIPLDKSIRIPYQTIYDSVREFDELLEKMKALAPSPPAFDRLEWDIYLSMINDYKGEILGRKGLDDSIRRNILVKNLPKFLWIAKASVRGKPAFDLVFDSTDIEQGKLLLMVVESDVVVCTWMRTVAKSLMSSNRLKRAIKEARFGPILEYLAAKPGKI
jgi:hypothetical protein